MKRILGLLLAFCALLMAGCNGNGTDVEIIPLKSISKMDVNDTAFENDTVHVVYEDGYEKWIGGCRKLFALNGVEGDENGLCFTSIFSQDLLLRCFCDEKNIKTKDSPDERGRKVYYFMDNGKAYGDFTAALASFLRENVTSQDLTAVSMPQGRTGVALADSLFANYQSLTSIKLPGTVKRIGAGCMSGCVALTDIHFDGTMAQWDAVEKGTDWDAKTGDYVVHCTDGDREKVWAENTDYTFSYLSSNTESKVTGLTLQSAWSVTLQIPAVDSEGIPVTAFDTDCLSFSTVPRWMLEADFLTYIKEPLEKAVARGEITEFASRRITEGYYLRVSLEGAGEEKRQALLEKYPYLESSAVYVLAVDMIAEEVLEVEAILERYAGMTCEINQKVAQNLMEAAAAAGMSRPHKYAPNVQDGDAIRKLEVAEGVTSLCAGAFGGCSNLVSAVLPSTLLDIANGLFVGCEALREINYGGTVEQWNALKKGANWDAATGDYVVHCVDGDVVKDTVE
ncbi:MAG: leucine-rich repeat protein [Clostridia bacterium]|nr:leucine-rich repeat protein [Clostridia bacterium]